MTNKPLSQKDVKKLDLILKTVIEKGTVFLKDMPPLDNGPISDLPEFCVNDYLNFLDIIKPFGILNITYYDRVSFKIETINIISQAFYDKGGFKTIYDEQQLEIEKNKEREKMSYEKLKWDLQVSKFQAEKKWWPFIISGLSFIISIIALFRGCVTKP